MKYRKRIYYTEADKALMWDRWQKGNSLHEIARLFDRPHSIRLAPGSHDLQDLMQWYRLYQRPRPRRQFIRNYPLVPQLPDLISQVLID